MGEVLILLYIIAAVLAVGALIGLVLLIAGIVQFRKSNGKKGVVFIVVGSCVFSFVLCVLIAAGLVFYGLSR